MAHIRAMTLLLACFFVGCGDAAGRSADESAPPPCEVTTEQVTWTTDSRTVHTSTESEFWLPWFERGQPCADIPLCTRGTLVDSTATAISLEVEQQQPYITGSRIDWHGGADFRVGAAYPQMPVIAPIDGIDISMANDYGVAGFGSPATGQYFGGGQVRFHWVFSLETRLKACDGRR